LAAFVDTGIKSSQQRRPHLLTLGANGTYPFLKQYYDLINQKPFVLNS
jgi:hypothetical protein